MKFIVGPFQLIKAHKELVLSKNKCYINSKYFWAVLGCMLV